MHDNANRLSSRTYPNGVNTTYEYDGMSRLTRLKDVSSTATLFDRQYSYNSANQISQIVEPSLSRVFGYDNTDRLTSVTGGSSENYVFDSVGNRTSSHRSSSYGYQPFNKIASTQTATYRSDPNGNMVQKSEGSNFWRYTFDHENRLAVAATRKQTVRYVYDALGRRVRRGIAGGKENTKFTYDGLDVMLDDNSGTLTKYLNGQGVDNKLRSQTGSSVNYFLSDHLGSTNGLTNSSGSVTASNSYDSFGNTTNASFPSRYQFTGREFDNFTGLQFSRARFYDPNLGRFISEDPIGFSGGDINLYGYVRNNPLNLTDPEGLLPFPSYYNVVKGLRTSLFGDGGYLSGPTIEEFFSAKERAKRECKSSWWQRFKYNRSETNASLPGLGAPSLYGIGVGAMTSGGMAKYFQTLTPLQYATNGFKGASLGSVAKATSANALAVTAAWEVGVGTGSAINATFGFSDYCPCE